MKAVIYIFIFVLCSGSVLQAQDLHFSQFNENPSLINPALTGVSGLLRASVVYKDQWRSVSVPYSTYGASVESRLRSGNWQQVDDFRTKTYKQVTGRLAAGLSAYNNTAGDGRMSQTQVNLSLASFIPTSDRSYVSLGIQAGLAQRRVDYSKLVFPNQYNGAAYDPSMNSSENFSSQNFLYPDLSAGLLWSHGYDEKAIAANDQLSADIGLAVYHLNRPRFRYFRGGNDHLDMRFVFHGKMLKGLANTNMALSPSYLVQVQGPAVEVLGGVMYKYYLNEASKYTGYVKRTSIGMGAYYRVQDALVASVLLEMKQLAVGFSYDINLSGLSRASYARGGAEITIRFNSAGAFLYQKKD